MRTLLLALAACGPPVVEPALEHAGGRVDAAEPGAFPGLLAVPDLDDDDEDGAPDWSSGAPDDDHAPLWVSGGGELALDGEGVRVWRGDELLLEDGGAVALEGDAELTVQVREPMGRGRLTLTSGDLALELPVTGAPLILNHHLQPVEDVWVMRFDDSFGDNAEMIAAMERALGDRLHVLRANRYDWDPWVQDEPELVTVTAPGQRLDVVLDSVRDRGLDPFPEDLQRPGTRARTYGERVWASTYDSFGNLEASPPIEGYPFGRVYWGEQGSSGLDPELAAVLRAQQVQAPFLVDTTWLCVGHVDEFTSFLPDPSAPRGFRFLVTDARAGLDLLAGLDPATALPRYAPNWSHGIKTVGELLEEPGLVAYNEDVQDLHIEPQIAVFREALGLADEEIVRIPGVFEEFRGCGAVALVPGSINLLVASVGGRPQVFMADPFVRDGRTPQDQDPFVQAIRAKLPPTVVPHFVDDFEVYHLGMGEVHCATNARRTPVGGWWDSALPLLEAE